MEIKNVKQLESYLRETRLFDLLGINRIGVFGSFARKEKFKDIDLLIEDEVNLDSFISFRDILKNSRGYCVRQICGTW